MLVVIFILVVVVNIFHLDFFLLLLLIRKVHFFFGGVRFDLLFFFRVGIVFVHRVLRIFRGGGLGSCVSIAIVGFFDRGFGGNGRCCMVMILSACITNWNAATNGALGHVLLGQGDGQQSIHQLRLQLVQLQSGITQTELLLEGGLVQTIRTCAGNLQDDCVGVVLRMEWRLVFRTVVQGDVDVGGIVTWDIQRNREHVVAVHVVRDLDRWDILLGHQGRVVLGRRCCRRFGWFRLVDGCIIVLLRVHHRMEIVTSLLAAAALHHHAATLLFFARG
mmetsp:Transcript_22829/g.64618  ORF Transcript_22829/g.64618 Transcript_22829/m.64618 type:complete len:276 (+) Transcript_22829:145-972(+)